jgi:hypothetical protein
MIVLKDQISYFIDLMHLAFIENLDLHHQYFGEIQHSSLILEYLSCARAYPRFDDHLPSSFECQHWCSDCMDLTCSLQKR